MTLKKELKDFYNSNRDYYLEARRLNVNLTDEREKAFRFIPAGSLVLDIGCGTAENGKFISEFARYVGLDFSTIALDMALDYKLKNFYLVKGDVSRPCFKPGSFDVVISTYSLEHFLAPRDVLDQMYNVCKKGGCLIIISPAWDLPFQFPPSMNFAGNIYRRFFYIILRIFEDLRECFFGMKYNFKIIRNPSFMTNGYSQDNDTVYLTKAREVITYLKHKGCKIMHASAERGAAGNIIFRMVKYLFIKIPKYKFGDSRFFVILLT